jgi:flagellar biosynthesis/type III secretory pathway M-ring protein FliF/YscJ
MRQYIPNIEYEGDVNAFPKHEVNFDDSEQTLVEVLPGETLRKQTSNREYLSTRRPNEEPGVQPNARRVANMGPWGYWYVDETRETNKTADTQMQNGRRETATRFAPRITNLTVSAILQLPYQYQRDDEGKLVQAVDDMGQPLIEPESRKPMWARESVELLPADRIEELKRQIAQAANIPLAEIPERIEVSQVPWTAPVVTPQGGEAFAALALRILTQNMTAIITFIFFALAVFIVYKYATRPIPTELDEYVEPEAVSLALTTVEDDEEEMGDDEWDKLRSKVTAAVQEDPKRAANLLRRWMRKD